MILEMMKYMDDGEFQCYNKQWHYCKWQHCNNWQWYDVTIERSHMKKERSPNKMKWRCQNWCDWLKKDPLQKKFKGIVVIMQQWRSERKHYQCCYKDFFLMLNNKGM